MLKKPEFWTRCEADVAVASEVELASYMVDEPVLVETLLRRLRGRDRWPFALRVYVDKDTFAGKTPHFQKSRLTALHRAGALVYICKGEVDNGSFHCKGVVADRRYLYTGSGNFTYQMKHKNREFLFRMVGPAVLQVLQELSEDRARGRLWDGP